MKYLIFSQGTYILDYGTHKAEVTGEDILAAFQKSLPIDSATDEPD
jgi:hypothetical protein